MATAKKPALKASLYVQVNGAEVRVDEKAIVAAVKKLWTSEKGKKVGDIATMDLYVKPEEAAAYYVINAGAEDEKTGRVEL